MTRKTTASKRSGAAKSKPTANQGIGLEKHLSKMYEIHPELRELVNNFLKQRNIPLEADALHFKSQVAGDYKCCIINGMVVCGPQCP